MTDQPAHPPIVRARARAFLLGALLVPLNAVFVIQVEVVAAAMQATNLSLFFNVVALLALLVALNAGLARLAPKQALTAAELRLVATMMAVGTALFGVDMLQIFLGLMPYPYYFATPENHWDTLLLPHLPTWLVVTDPKALDDLYRGYSTLFTPEHLQAWTRPVIVWGCFLAGLLSFSLGLASLLRKPWAEHERLTFPIIALPIAMTEPGGSLWRDKLGWLGFSLAAGLNLMRALHTWIPAVPEIPQKTNLQAAFAAPPWNAVGWCPLSWYPFAIGLGYLMPLELSFSCWLFFILWKVQLILRAMVGWGPLEGSWIGAQGVGAWIGLGVMAIYVTRRELARTLRAVGRPGPDDGEGLAPRQAWTAIVVGLVVVIAIGHRAGFTFAAVAGFFALYLVLVIAIARMRAELGPPSHDLPRGGPDRILKAFLGPGSFGPRNLTLFTLFDWLTYSYRAHPVAHQLEGYQIAARSQLDRKQMTAAMILAMVVAYVAFMVLGLEAIYHHGFQARIRSYLDDAAGQAWGEVAAVLQGQAGPNLAYIRQFSGGLIVTCALALLRQRFMFFPLHPVGYAVNGNWTMSHLWCSLFLAWALKLTLVKSGGLKAYRRGLPFCFGLMLGDCLVGGGLCLVSTWTSAPVRGFFP